MPARIARRLWMMVEEPRVRRALWSAAYTWVTIAGLAALYDPPRSIEHQIGPALTITWGLLLAVGGCLGAWSTLTKWWFVERSAIILTATGSMFYAVTVLVNHLLEPGNRVPQLAFIIAFIMSLGIRYWDIRRFNRSPHDQ